MSREEIEQFIEPFNKLDLLQRLSTLYFFPENTHHSPATFYYLNQIVLSQNFDSEKEISHKKFKQLIENAKSSFGHLDDPFEQAFTEEISFFDGPHIIFPGYLRGSKYIIQNLLNSIFLSDEFRDSSFFQEVLKHIRIVLSLSDELAQRFALERNQPVEEFGEIVFPQNIKTLKQYVCFTEEELLRLFQGQNSFLSIFKEEYTFSLDEFEFTDDPEKDIQVNKPFLNYNDLCVITELGNLINSLRQKIFQIAAKHEVLEKVLELYHNSVWHGIHQSLEFLDARKINAELPPIEEDLKFNEGIWGFDIDKAIYLATIEDHLANFDIDESFGTWDAADSLENISNRAGKIAEFITKKYEGINDVYIIFVLSSLGRNSILLVPNIASKYSSTFLTLNSFELKILSHIEGGKDLALYKFSLAKDQLMTTTQIISFSFLDTYNLFKSNEYTFYLSDEPKPNIMHIGIGDGRYLINEYLDKLDRHLIHNYDGKYFTEVIRLNGDSRIPIYMDPTGLKRGDKRALAVEGFRIPIWIVEDERTDSNLLRGRLFAEFIEMTAYWIWQLTPYIKKYLDLIYINHNSLSIFLDFENYDSWNSMVVEETENESRVAEYSIEKGKQVIFVKIQDAFQLKSNRPDNLAEREYVTVIIDAFSDYLIECGFEIEAKKLLKEKNQIIELCAPLGPKKKIISLSSLENFVVDSTNLPQVRYVQKFDENKQLDNLGVYLIEKLEYKEGDYYGEDAVELLNQAVAFFYKELSQIISELPGEKTLKHFVSQYERIVQKRELRKITIPTQLACYSTEEELQDQIIEETENVNKTSIACRFIIELLASNNPKGDQPLSMQAYDEIMAKASELINWAFLSDLIHFDIVDLKISILPSLRLGVDRSVLEKANNAFHPLRTKEHIDKAIQNFSDFWKKKSNESENEGSKPDLVKIIDEAHLDEFGISVTDLSLIYGDLIDLGFNISNQPYKEIEKEKLIEELLKSGDYNYDTLITGLDLIALKQRESFLSPKDPYTKEDVYPWRFMRPLSYLRKPLIEVQSEDETTKIIWGNRSLKASFDYLQEITLSGRIHGKLKSKKFQKVMGQIHRDIGREFNNLAYRKIASVSDNIIIEKELKKIGSTKIGAPNNELGDVDVLVIIPKKKNIFVLECKDLAIARNPHEMANEIEALFKGNRGKKSTVEKHQNRLNWLIENKDLLFNKYKLKPRGNWQFYSFIIVDEEMFTPHLQTSNIEVLTLPRFLELFKQYL